MIYWDYSKGGERMNSKLILVVIIALVAVFAGFIFLGNRNTSPTTSINQSDSMKSEQASTPAALETNGQIVNIVLGDSGFVPKDTTVKAGTTVIWVNKGGKDATINSDDHPTHSLYPFLNLGKFPSSYTLQVVFDKPGKYSYHDHYNATSKGTVTVE